MFTSDMKINLTSGYIIRTCRLNESWLFQGILLFLINFIYFRRMHFYMKGLLLCHIFRKQSNIFSCYSTHTRKSACIALHFTSFVNRFSSLDSGTEIHSSLIKYLARACGVHGGREVETELWLENLKGCDHL